MQLVDANVRLHHEKHSARRDCGSRVALVCLLPARRFCDSGKKKKKNALFNTCAEAELSAHEEMSRLRSTHGTAAPTVIILCGVTEMSDGTVGWSESERAR